MNKNQKPIGPKGTIEIKLSNRPDPFIFESGEEASKFLENERPSRRVFKKKSHKKKKLG